MTAVLGISCRMRTKLEGMGGDKTPVRDRDAEARERYQDAIDDVEGYNAGKGNFIMFDGDNPLAWILSDVHGTPPDLKDAVDRNQDEDPGRDDEIDDDGDGGGGRPSGSDSGV